MKCLVLGLAHNKCYLADDYSFFFKGHQSQECYHGFIFESVLTNQCQEYTETLPKHLYELSLDLKYSNVFSKVGASIST